MLAHDADTYRHWHQRTIHSEFAKQLKKALPGPLDDSTAAALLRTAKDHVSSASNALSHAASRRGTSLEDVAKHGTDLWNQCISLRRSKHGPGAYEHKDLVLQATALAFLMLAMPHRLDKLEAEDGMLLLSVAVTASRHCLGELEHATERRSAKRGLTQAPPPPQLEETVSAQTCSYAMPPIMQTSCKIWPKMDLSNPTRVSENSEACRLSILACAFSM